MQQRRFNLNPVRLLIGLASVLASTLGLASQKLIDDVSHHYADNDGVKIHYVKTGSGPLVVMIHGFPDFWYSWRAQMEALKDNFTVVAMDQRGYNLSGQPDGIAAYAMPNLIADVAAVVAAEGNDKATIVGHDWGGAVAWQVAFAMPEMVENLVIMNLPIQTAWRVSWPTMQNSSATANTRNASLPAARMIRPSSAAIP